MKKKTTVHRKHNTTIQYIELILHIHGDALQQFIKINK